MKSNSLWILVADGARARLFCYHGPNEILQLVENGEFSHINKPSRELVSTKRGRVFHSADSSRSAMERPTDPHEHDHAIRPRPADPDACRSNRRRCR